MVTRETSAHPAVSDVNTRPCWEAFRRWDAGESAAEVDQEGPRLGPWMPVPLFTLRRDVAEQGISISQSTTSPWAAFARLLRRSMLISGHD